MVNKAQLDAMAQEALGSQKLTAGFLDVYKTQRRYSFYTGGPSKQKPDFVPRHHARTIAARLTEILTASSVDFHLCAPYELPNGKYKVELILPRF